MTAATLILLPLGSALGFALASPWHTAMPLKTFSVANGIWIVVVQWLSAALGGYITGRLRAKWVGAHTHEVFFRDTVHGFLAWALSALVATVLLASMATHLAAGAAAGSNEQQGVRNGSINQSIYADRLFRSDRGPTTISEQDRVEATHLLIEAENGGDMSEADRVYLAHLVSDRTGLAEADAQTRVDNVIMQDKVAADKARKVAAAVSLFMSLAMLIGAFVASVGGALGGRDRDIHYYNGRFYE